MIGKQLKIIFDATVVANAEVRDGNRSGIFFVAYNLLIEMASRADMEVKLFVSPSAFRALRRVLAADSRLAALNLEIVNGDGASFSLEALLRSTQSGGWGNGFLMRKLFRAWTLAVKLAIALNRRGCRSRRLADELRKSDVFFSPIYLAPRQVLRSGARRCTFIHDTIPLLFPQYFPYVKWHCHWQLALFHALDGDDWCFANSECTRRDLLRFAPGVAPGHVAVTPLAAAKHFYLVDDAAAVAACRRRYGIPEGKRYFFSLCTLEPRKNLPFAIGAFLRYLESCGDEDVLFVIGGGHWQNFDAAMAALLKRAPDGKLLRIGYVDDDDLKYLYSGALASVYLSVYEGFGMPVLEAMQCGCPVLCSDTSSLPEVAGDAAVMTSPNDEAAAAAAFAELAHDSELRGRLRAAGLRRAAGFSWEKCVDLMLDGLHGREPGAR